MKPRILLIEASAALASCAERAAEKVSAILERTDLDNVDERVRTSAPEVIAAPSAVFGDDPDRFNELAAQVGAVLVSIDDDNLDHGELALLFQTTIDAAAERRAPSPEPEAEADPGSS